MNSTDALHIIARIQLDDEGYQCDWCGDEFTEDELEGEAKGFCPAGCGEKLRGYEMSIDDAFDTLHTIVRMVRGMVLLDGVLDE